MKKAIGVLLIMLVATVVVTPAAQAQTYTILHSFTEGADGSRPVAGLTMDTAGNLYGTASAGPFDGFSCCGTVFKLTHMPAGWMFAPLYGFPQGFQGGADPIGKVVFGPDGGLYGTTPNGIDPVFGTVFKLTPPPRPCHSVQCPWTETVLFRFNRFQGFGTNNIVFDQAGNIYGTTDEGSHTVYKLTPNGGSWTETILHTLSGGAAPSEGVILDSAGNLYGNAYIPTSGMVYELTNPGGQFQVLHRFNGPTDGFDPQGGLIFDSAGNLYGGALCGGANGEGTVYRMSPSQGSWTLTVLYNFAQGDPNYCGGPYGQLFMDAAGNLYGTTHSGGAYQFGSVFKLTPSGSGWAYTSLHDFCSGGYPCADGGYPFGNVVMDGAGNLYGTASIGGAHSHGVNNGVVWEITP